MTIDKTKIEPLVKNNKNKGIPASSFANLIKELKMFILDLYSVLKNFSVYDLAQWLLCTNNWIQNYKTSKNIPCKRGDIIMVDLGSNNFGHEASYAHPCVVLFQQKDFLIVLPGSTGKYKNKSSFNFDCIEGFAHPSGIQLDQVRYISKSRITTGVLGNVGTSTLNYIDSFIFKNYCGGIEFQVENMVNEIIQIYQNKLKIKDTEIEDLKNRLDKLDSKYIELQKERIPSNSNVYAKN